MACERAFHALRRLTEIEEARKNYIQSIVSKDYIDHYSKRFVAIVGSTPAVNVNVNTKKNGGVLRRYSSTPVIRNCTANGNWKRGKRPPQILENAPLVKPKIEHGAKEDFIRSIRSRVNKLTMANSHKLISEIKNILLNENEHILDETFPDIADLLWKITTQRPEAATLYLSVATTNSTLRELFDEKVQNFIGYESSSPPIDSFISEDACKDQESYDRFCEDRRECEQYIGAVKATLVLAGSQAAEIILKQILRCDNEKLSRSTAALKSLGSLRPLAPEIRSRLQCVADIAPDSRYRWLVSEATEIA